MSHPQGFVFLVGRDQLDLVLARVFYPPLARSVHPNAPNGDSWRRAVGKAEVAEHAPGALVIAVGDAHVTACRQSVCRRRELRPGPPELEHSGSAGLLRRRST